MLHKGSDDSPALALECTLCHQSILETCCSSSTSNAHDVLRVSSSSHPRGSSAAQLEQKHRETTCVPCESLLLLASGCYSDRTGKAGEEKPSYDWSANWLVLFTEIHLLESSLVRDCKSNNNKYFHSNYPVLPFVISCCYSAYNDRQHQIPSLVLNPQYVAQS